MRVTFILWLAMAVLALAMAPGVSKASEALAGAFASEGTGARPLGMGGAFVALADDANATYSNPAGMAFFDGKARFATFTHSNLFSLNLLTRDFVAYSQGDEGSYGAFGISWNRFNASLDPEQYTEDTIMYSGAKMLTSDQRYPQYALGWNLKYLRVNSGFSESTDYHTVAGGNATGYGADVGLIFKPRESLSLGVFAQDVYSVLNWDSKTLEVLPTAGAGGLAYKVTKSVVAAGEIRLAQTSAGFSPVSWHAGLESWFFNRKELQWGLLRDMALRAGYQQQIANADGGQVSAGASALGDSWQIDYAYQFPLSNTGLSATHRFGISFVF